MQVELKLVEYKMKLSDLINEETMSTSVNAGPAKVNPPLSGTNLKRNPEKKRKFNGDVVHGQVDLAPNDPSSSQKSPSIERKGQFKGDVAYGKVKKGVTYTTEEIKEYLKDKLTNDTLRLIGLFKSNENKEVKK